MINKKLIDRCVDIAHGIELVDELISLRTRHFAFILNKNKILKIGINRQKTHPILKNRKYNYGHWTKLHAEADAVIKSGEIDQSNNKMLTFRFDSSNNLNIGKPCKFCMKLLKDCNFKTIVYSNELGKFEKL